MNNWRLLLLAVVAVLQPIESFTGRKLIDGREACCDHRSNSITQDTRLYGNQHKSNTEEGRLSTRDDIRENRRYEARNDPITQSREKLIVERAGRRISLEPARSRITRDNHNRRLNERFARDASSKYERDTLGSRGVVMVSRDGARNKRTENKRFYRDADELRDARRVQTREDLRRISNNRETMVLLNQESDDVERNIRRDSRINAVRSVISSDLENNRERRTLAPLTNENRRSQSVGPRVRIYLREDRRNDFRATSERAEVRRQLNQNREYNDRIDTIRRLSVERMSVEHRYESRDTSARIKLNKRERHTERTDERRQQRDENRLSKGQASMARRNIRSERIVRSSERKGENRDAEGNMLRTSRLSIIERRQDSRMSEPIGRRESRLARSDENRREHRQLQPRPLDRISDSRASRGRSIIHEQNDGVTARLAERNIREVRAAKYSREFRSLERVDERRHQHDESRLSRDQNKPMLRDSRNDSEQRQVPRNTGSLLRGVVEARSERESRTRENVRYNENVDSSRREREPRAHTRESEERSLTRIVRESERTQERDLSRTTQFTERAQSTERRFRAREDIRRERIDVRREIRGGEKQSSERTVSLERLTRDNSAPKRRYDTLITSRTAETSARLQTTRNIDNVRDERRGRGEGRISGDRVTRERSEDRRTEAREIRDSLANARREVTRNSRDVRMNSRYEIQRDVQRSARDILATRSAQHRSREITKGDVEIRAERLSRNRDERKTNERDVRTIRDFRAIESGAESISERENRRNTATERMERPANRESRGLRFEARPSVLDKDTRAFSRQNVIDSRYRNIESKIHYIDPVDEPSETPNVMDWKMIFYTLQGAYLCGILMQILTEKSNGKTRNFTWWASSSKELVKVD